MDEFDDIDGGGELEPPATPLIGDGLVVNFHYRLAEIDNEGKQGDWFEQSFGGEPLSYLHGYHNVVVGLERALEGKQIGDLIEITLTPTQAYGDRDPEAVRRMPIKQIRYLRGGDKPRIGMMAAVKTNQGLVNGILLRVGKFNCDIDFNHPLAGRTLHYQIEVVAIRPASQEELAAGRAAGRGGNLGQGVPGP